MENFKEFLDAIEELKKILQSNSSLDIEEAMILYLEKRRYTVMTDAEVHGF